ncbi:DNA topoisomerase IV subunit A [Nosocomiicoccus ampullae]|uniref:DNA topoisomerase IV subunit A n=1 Tax=Nosocomiicoccus ampullae TaxID=489910 RepID=UPI001C5CE7A4|nr:DNA topoisomerase IV subunit A [Nosocomiicoccus ampullae]QYA47782.1 DNA topoisomerase IV subunit A [Nosocomiicoccus ampullae]
MHKQIQQLKLEDVIGDRFGRYSKYVIQDRAIPDVRDGLKPVQRRILYAMYKDGNTFDKGYRKSAKTVGNVIGNYHPHGESSIYDAMIRLGQDWKMREELVQIHGNKGSVDGDPPAAMRYTEARLSHLSQELLSDINKNTVDFIDNFDDTTQEPTVLPSKFPNILVNGSTGISAGYATDIPPHNLEEVINATLKVIDKPTVKIDELLEIMPGPDFPTGGIIQGKKELKKAYETGQGRIVVRAKVDVEKMRGDKVQLVITELPFEVNKANLVKKIDEIIIDKAVDGMLEVRDETDRDGLRVIIELRKDSNVDAILNYLYKKTNLQISYNFNMVAIDNRRPKLLSLKDILVAYVEYQKEVVLRRSKYLLDTASKRMHIIEGLMRAMSILDEVIRIIRESENKRSAKENLMNAYDFTEKQAEAIVMLQLYRLTNTDIVDLENEHIDLEYEINTLKDIIENENTLKKVIKKELRDVKKTFKSERLTVIEEQIESLEVSREMLIREEDTVVTVTRDGYIKRTSPRSFSASPFEELGKKDDDELLFFKESHTLETLLIFTNKGNYMIIPVHELEDIRWKDHGVHLSSKYNLDSQEHPIFAYEIESFDIDESIVITTKNGQVKRTSLKDHEMTRINRAISAINLSKDDEVVSVDVVKGESNILLLTKQGISLIFNINEVSDTGLRTKGVKGISLKENDAVISGNLTTNQDYVLSVTNRGAVKRTSLKEFEIGKRSQVGRALYKNVKSKPHEVLRARLFTEDFTVSLISDENREDIQAMDIRLSEMYSNGSFIVDEDTFGEIDKVIFSIYS